MANYPGPYEIEYELSGWTAPARTHVMRFSCAVLANPPAGTLATAIDVQKTGGATAKLNVVANQLWEFIRNFYPAAVTCPSYTLWKYVTGTLAKNFISTGALTNTGGVAGGTISPTAQLVQTYRSANGGILKVVVLESLLTGDTRVTLVPNAAGNASQKLAAYILSADNIVLARDDSYPITALRDSRGQNERIWREIYR